eukprot:gene14611-biopygen17112
MGSRWNMVGYYAGIREAIHHVPEGTRQSHIIIDHDPVLMPGQGALWAGRRRRAHPPGGAPKGAPAAVSPRKPSSLGAVRPGIPRRGRGFAGAGQSPFVAGPVPAPRFVERAESAPFPQRRRELYLGRCDSRKFKQSHHNRSKDCSILSDRQY